MVMLGTLPVFEKAQVDSVVAKWAPADPLIVVGLLQTAQSRRRQRHRSKVPFRDAPGKADEAI